VHDATVRVAGPDGVFSLALTALLADRSRLAGRIITAVTIDTGGVTAAVRAGRTPADRAIVAAVVRHTSTGELRIALTGVAATPVVIAAIDSIDELRPPGDFRGSSEYRRALAGTHTARALEAVR
jgi:CO/xanthine dehydrogenase FAD-binding subunit